MRTAPGLSGATASSLPSNISEKPNSGPHRLRRARHARERVLALLRHAQLSFSIGVAREPRRTMSQS